MAWHADVPRIMPCRQLSRQAGKEPEAIDAFGTPTIVHFNNA
jgi:hypothetical protein